VGTVCRAEDVLALPALGGVAMMKRNGENASNAWAFLYVRNWTGLNGLGEIRRPTSIPFNDLTVSVVIVTSCGYTKSEKYQSTINN